MIESINHVHEARKQTLRNERQTAEYPSRMLKWSDTRKRKDITLSLIRWAPPCSEFVGGYEAWRYLILWKS